MVGTESITGEVLEADPGAEFVTEATSRTYGAVSRLLDALLSSTLLVLVSPVMLLGALLVLLTDGRSNAGEVPLEVAAALARSTGVRVHTVGIGSAGEEVPMRVGGDAARGVKLLGSGAIMNQVLEAKELLKDR